MGFELSSRRAVSIAYNLILVEFSTYLPCFRSISAEIAKTVLSSLLNPDF